MNMIPKAIHLRNSERNIQITIPMLGPDIPKLHERQKLPGVQYSQVNDLDDDLPPFFGFSSDNWLKPQLIHFISIL